MLLIGGMDFRSDGTLFAAVNIAGDGGTGSDHLAIIDIKEKRKDPLPMTCMEDGVCLLKLAIQAFSFFFK